MTEQTKQQVYIGRFAPSPSGPLHFGSLMTALAAFIDAKANKGKLLLRIDNIDPPREQPGAIENISETLKDFNLLWDDQVIFQSERYPLYLEFVIKLIENNLAYPCYCSRKQLSDYSQYPGTCRKHLDEVQKQTLIKELRDDSEHVFSATQPKQLSPLLSHYSVRLDTSSIPRDCLDFYDGIQGLQHCPKDFGDFILLRKDRLPSYMLACALDEIYDGINHIVRGSDLLQATFWQRSLQYLYLRINPRNSNTQSPELPFRYAHLPIITNELNQKLSKQHHAPAIYPDDSRNMLLRALSALGQNLPPSLGYTSNTDILLWAIEHWNLSSVPADSIAFDDLKA